MEGVGLALALASLFSTCVECFGYIEAGRSYGRDQEILLAKLDVEKTLLLQWGDRVGILSDDPGTRDARIDQYPTRSTVERVLNCISMLLTDAECLRKK